MVGPVCVCEGGLQITTEAWATLILGDSKFILLLKTVLTFNHKTNDVIVSNIDHSI